jgi:DNA-binding CsgD family transcriptional regulator
MPFFSESTEAEWLEAKRRASILRPLIATKRFPRTIIRAAATELGVSERLVYVYIRRLRDAEGDPTVLLPTKATGGRGKSRIPPETDKLIQSVIAEVAASSCSAVPIDEVIHKVLERCQQQQTPMPSSSTIRRRVAVRSNRPAPSTVAPGTEVLLSKSKAPQDRPTHPNTSDFGPLLECLYDVVARPDGWTSFLAALASSYPGGVAALYVHDGAINYCHADAAGMVATDYLTNYNEYYAKINPWLTNIAKRPVGIVVPAEFMLPRADLVRTEFYNDWLRPQGLLSGVSATIQQDGSRVMAASVLFPGTTRERDSEAINRLQLLAPHLLRVAQLKRQLSTLEARTAVTETVLDRLSAAVVIVDCGGQVTFLNKAAARIIAAKDGITLIRNSLQTAVLNEGQAFQTLIMSALKSRWTPGVPPGGVMRVSRPSGRLPYEVLISPISGGTLDLGPSGAAVGVFLHDPEARADAPLQWLRRLYSLTEAEALVMHALMGGETLAEIAVKFGKRVETVRTQLKSIFRKTGTESQSELVRRGLGSALSSLK